MLKAHVTFDEVTRVLSFEEGEEIRGLRPLFIQQFYDVLSDDITPEQVKFHRYDENLNGYEELPDGEKLEENVILKAVMVQCQIGTFPIDFKCRMWNVVSRQNSSLLQRHPSQNDLVECDGSFDNLSADAEVTIKDSQKDHYILLFNDKYAMVTNGEGGPINAIDTSTLLISPASATQFKPIFNGNYWLFQAETSSELYLGCLEDGNTTLVKMKTKDFPNPQALFIVNQIN